MTTQEQIDEIIKSKYHGYKGTWGERFRRLHNYLRKYNTDEQFLKHLQDCEAKYPRPVYGQSFPSSELIINQPIKTMEQKSYKQQLSDLQHKYRRRTRIDLIMITLCFIALAGTAAFVIYLHKDIVHRSKTMQHEQLQETKKK